LPTPEFLFQVRRPTFRSGEDGHAQLPLLSQGVCPESLWPLPERGRFLQQGYGKGKSGFRPLWKSRPGHHRSLCCQQVVMVCSWSGRLSILTTYFSRQNRKINAWPDACLFRHDLSFNIGKIGTDSSQILPTRKVPHFIAITKYVELILLFPKPHLKLL
jgi:hypothetical protein